LFWKRRSLDKIGASLECWISPHGRNKLTWENSGVPC
jgi:hypothetical protein